MKRLLAVILSAMMLICSVNMTVLAEAIDENADLFEDALAEEIIEETPAEDAEDIEESVEETQADELDSNITDEEEKEFSLALDDIVPFENVLKLSEDVVIPVINNPGEGVNVFENKITWNMQGWGSTPQAATDGNDKKAWDASNRNPGQAQQLWIQVNPEGEAPVYYNKIKMNVRQWNSRGYDIYTSNELTGKVPNKSGPNGAPPNLKNGVNRYSFRFEEPYPAFGNTPVEDKYITGASLTPAFTFTGTTDRFVRFENIVAYPTGTVANVDPVSFRLWEIEAFFTGPQYISNTNVDAPKEELDWDENGNATAFGDYQIVLPESGTKEVATKAVVIDTEGDIFEDDNFLDLRYTLVDEDGEPIEIDGISLDEETGILSVDSVVEGLDEPDTMLTVKIKSENIYTEKNKPYLDAFSPETYESVELGDVIQEADVLTSVQIIRKNPVYYEVNKLANSITWDMIKGDNTSPDKVIANLNLPQYRRFGLNEYYIISPVGEFDATEENPIALRRLSYTFVENVDENNIIEMNSVNEEGSSVKRFNGTAVVNRLDSMNVPGKLRLTFRMNKDGYDESATKEFDITVLKNGYVENLCTGSTSWNVNAGWGNGSRITDGLPNSVWTPGAHTGGAAATAGIWLGEPKTFNRIAITMQALDVMSFIKLVAYDEMVMDLDKSGYGPVDPGTGPKKLFELTSENVYDYVETDEEGIETIVFDLKKNVTKEFIMIEMGTSSADGSASIAELELFFATPTDVECEAEEYRVPGEMASENSLTYALPTVTKAFHTETITKVKADDEESADGEEGEEEEEEVITTTTTREITTDFIFKWLYKGNDAGVSVDEEAGTITFTKDYEPETIELTLEVYDITGIKQLSKAMEFATLPTTEDYYAIREIAEDVSVGEERSDGKRYIVDDEDDSTTDLPTELEGATIEYTVYDQNGEELDIIDEDGNVFYPSYEEGSEEVTIVATITLGDETFKKTFENVVVFKEATDEQKLIYDMDNLSLDLPRVVKHNITLPTSGFLGSRITWESSAPTIISNRGVYTPATGNGTKEIVLTATLTYNGLTKTKTFRAYVKLTSGGGGGAGGGGGSSSDYVGALGSTLNGVTDYTAPIQNVTSSTQPITDPNLLNSMFIDLPVDHWAKKHIESLAKQGIVSGGGNNMVNPDGQVTREQFVKMILEAFDVTLKPASTKFADVNIDEWYYSYVVTAEALGLVNGMSETSFGIGVNISRQDMAVIIQNAVKMFGIEFLETETADFNDAASIADYAKDAVKFLQNSGILNGDQNKNFNPTSTASRAESMKVIDVIMTTGV